MHQEKLWSKNFILSILSGFFSSMILYMTITTLTEYTMDLYSISTSAGGFVAAILLLGGAVGRVISGRFLNTNRKRLVIAIGLLSLVTSLLYIPPTSLAVFFTIRFFHGFASGAFHNCIATIVVSYIPKQRLGEGLSIFSLSFPVATAAGPFVGIMLINAISYQAMFIAAAVCAGITLIFLLLMDIEDPIEENEPPAEGKRSISSFFASFIEVKAIPLAFTIAIFSMCYSSVTTFIVPYLNSINLASTASIFFIVYACCILVFRPMAGKLLDRKGDNFVLLPAIMFFALGFLVLSFTSTQIMAIAAAIILALGFGNILNTGHAITVKKVPPEDVGRATTTYFVFTDISMGIGPPLLGLIATAKGFAGMYRYSIIIIIIAMLLYLIVHGRKSKRQI